MFYCPPAVFGSRHTTAVEDRPLLLESARLLAWLTLRYPHGGVGYAVLFPSASFPTCWFLVIVAFPV
jgi:hypothetical protein